MAENDISMTKKNDNIVSYRHIYTLTKMKASACNDQKDINFEG